MVVVAGVEVERVEYTYKGLDVETGLSLAIGSDGDLVQVVKSVLVDLAPAGSSPWHRTVTQYRYFHEDFVDEDEEEAEDDLDGDGFAHEFGNPHQLKAVILPAQLEYAARHATTGTPDDETVVAFATALLALDDGDVAFNDGDDRIVMNLAAKVVERYELFDPNDPEVDRGRVMVQYLQSACGCAGGSAQGLKLEYTYWHEYASSPDDGDFARTTVVDYWQSDGQGGYDPHLTHYYDLVTYTIASGSGTSSTYYLANVAIEGSTSNRWVAHADYDATTRARVRMISPSAVASYTPAGPSSAPSISFRTDDGYVQEYQYTANHRLAAAGVRKGTAGALSLVTRSEFDTERPWLPVKQESLRVEDLTSGNASSSADDIQTVLVRYGFHEDPITEDETDAVAWIEVEFEAELGAENGPGGTHVAHSFFDERGRMHWSRQADDTLTRRTYDDATGALLTSVSNASPTGLPDHPTHAAASWGGRTAQGGSLAVEYVYDTLGRVRSVVSSAGTAIHYVRTLRELDDGRHDDRPGVLHLALVSLPHHWLDGTTDRFAGPANVRYIDAAGATVATVDHTLVAGTADGFGDVVDGYDFELDDQIARSTVTHSLAGMVLRSTQWHSLAGHGENDGYYETIYTYDTLGRLASTQEPGGNISAYDYDERSRVVRVRVGTTTLNLQTVVELFHDSPGTAAHGVGDGVVTLVRTHTGEDSGNEVHDTVLTYDYRNRLVKIKNPAAPHAFVVYDNLDRVVQAAAFSVPAANVPDDIHDSSKLANRGAYTETSYSQRGLAFRQRVAIDPTEADPAAGEGFLETHAWHDANARVVGRLAAFLGGPNGPASKVTFDGLGRAIATYVTDRGGDGNPGAGSHAEVYVGAPHYRADLDGDVVFEQVEYTYREEAGFLDLVTARARTHDAADSKTGDLAAFSGGDADLVIASFTGFEYDEAVRVVSVVEFGNWFERSGEPLRVRPRSLRDCAGKPALSLYRSILRIRPDGSSAPTRSGFP